MQSNLQEKLIHTSKKTFILIMHVSPPLHLDSILTWKWCESISNMLIKRKCIEFGYITYRLSLPTHQKRSKYSHGCLFSSKKYFPKKRYVNFFFEFRMHSKNILLPIICIFGFFISHNTMRFSISDMFHIAYEKIYNLIVFDSWIMTKCRKIKWVQEKRQI